MWGPAEAAGGPSTGSEGGRRTSDWLRPQSRPAPWGCPVEASGFSRSGTCPGVISFNLAIIPNLKAGREVGVQNVPGLKSGAGGMDCLPRAGP